MKTERDNLEKYILKKIVHNQINIPIINWAIRLCFNADITNEPKIPTITDMPIGIPISFNNQVFS